MSTVPNTTSTYNSTSGTNNSTTGNAFTQAANKELGKDAFLQLLVAELRNQDPLAPMDNKEMISQLTQFSSLEQMNNMSESIQKLNAQMSAVFQHSLLSQGAALIGKIVAGADTDGETIISGLVEAVNWLDGNPQLQIRLTDGNVKYLDMNQITYVTDAITSPEPDNPNPPDNNENNGKDPEEDITKV